MTVERLEFENEGKYLYFTGLVFDHSSFPYRKSMSFPEANDPKALLNTNRDSFLTYREKIELGTTEELPNCCRLFDHQDDPDIDEPYQAPQGHVLGKEATGSQDFVVYMQYIEY